MIESCRDPAWQKAMERVEGVYGATFELPDHEGFGQVARPRRAATSIPSALIEGRARSSTREFAHDVPIGEDSMADVETQVSISQRLGFLPREPADGLRSQCAEQSRVLRGLAKSLDNRIVHARKQRAPTPRPLRSP